MIRQLYMALMISALTLTWVNGAHAQVRVVTSIKPLQMIASAITEGVSEPVLLIPSTQSYHHFVLRPSSVRTLNQAELFVWVGPELETYLTGAIQQGRSQQQVLQVLALPGLVIHHAGHDGEDAVEIIVPEDGLHAGHKHAAGGDIDPHLWLDTRNARAIARAITEQLVQIDEQYQPAYTQNLAIFEQSLDALETTLNASLRMPEQMQYAVYHDAFRYFERQFGLQHDVVFVGSEEIQPGVRHMLALREAVENRNINCLMEDVTSQSSTVDTVLGKKEVERVRADTTGQSLTSGPTAYIQLIENLANAFRQCFGQ
jgi:zinc transport system substrate-binding protein